MLTLILAMILFGTPSELVEQPGLRMWPGPSAPFELLSSPFNPRRLLAQAATPAAQPIVPSIAPAPDAYGLDEVQDVTSLSHNDAKPYYGLLHLADSVSQRDLREAGEAFVAQRRKISKEAAFPDMLHHPEAWRGKPVTLTGHILQTVEYAAEDNPYGIKKLYESALYTEDSVHHPISVVYLHKPDNLPLGGELVGSVGVSGYFLKMYIYPSADNKTRKSPLILAKTITVFPPRQQGPIVPPTITYLLVAIVAIAAVLGVWKLTRQPRRRPHPAGGRQDSQPDFSDF